VLELNLKRLETEKKKANYRIKGSKFGKKKQRTNFKADVNTIYELEEEYLNTRQMQQYEERLN
jgi:hypothetical protein